MLPSSGLHPKYPKVRNKVLSLQLADFTGMFDERQHDVYVMDIVWIQNGQ